MHFRPISSNDLCNALMFGTTTACSAQKCMTKCRRRVPSSFPVRQDTFVLPRTSERRRQPLAGTTGMKRYRTEYPLACR